MIIKLNKMVEEIKNKEIVRMILAIVGPTGVGKTRLSIELAKIYNGEIINADSMQIYKGLDIGTAKATKEEMAHIPHHLLSIKEATENYTVFDYQHDARECIEKIKNKKKIPIFVGGTGYYLKSVFYDYKFESEKETDTEKYKEVTNEELREKIDSFECGITYDNKNRNRMMRLLTKLESGWTPTDEEFKLVYEDVYFIGLTTDREILYEKINDRFDKMLVPLIDEVKPFYLQNIKTKPLMTGIGYKELYSFFENKKTLVNVVEECKQNSRNYAKRQYTWFQNQMEVTWFHVDYDNFSNTIKEVVKYIENDPKEK